ncbi:MAG: restriction endonuclease subunit S [Anaerolineaceae bacterium]|nr:restriction endonuclease subunit S [Anaerolineaceae bacterium]
MKYGLVQLGDLGEIVSGSTPDTSNKTYWGGEIPWITPADLTDHEGIYFNGNLRKITQSGYKSCSTKLLPEGSIIFSSRAPIGHSAVTAFPLCTNQGFKSIIPNDRLHSIYGFYALKFFTPQIESLGRGATFTEVNKEIFENIRIPLPPLPEQQRIAAILQKADRLRRLRRYARRLSDTYLQSVFLEMFGDISANSKNWKIKNLRNVSLIFSDGPFGSDLKSEHYKEIGVRVIRLQNVGVGELIDDDKAYVSVEHFESLRKQGCLPGDVIIGTLGDPNLRACILPDDISIALNKADCIQMRVNPKEMTKEYACWLLNMPQTLFLATGMIHGQTRSRINMGRLAELEIPVPPLAKQECFVHVVNRYKFLKVQERESERQAEHLFQSLLEQAFQGEL